MNAKGRPAQSDSESNYEAAVLDFLDKEMAGTQSTLTEKKQSEELDALVADLLHQVMAESDQPQSGEMSASSEDMKDLLAEFMPQQETVSHPVPASASPHPETVTIRTESISSDEGFTGQGDVVSPVLESSMQTSEDKASAKLAAALFASQLAQKRRTPLRLAAALFASPMVQNNKIPLIAAAVVCLLAGIGVPAYYFSGSSAKAPSPIATQTAMPVAVAPVAADPIAQPSVQPAAKAASPKATPPVLDKNAVAANSKTPVPVAATVKPAVTQIVTPPPVPVDNTVNPTSAKEEKSAEPQSVQSAQPVMAQPAPDNPAPAVADEKPAPASVAAEIMPAQQTPVITARVNNTLPAPPPPVATAAAAPTVQRNLIPAIAISQVSPKFPEFALRTRTSASVVLELDVDKQGKVVKATPVSGPRMFHKEAINAAMQWRYRPASIGGANVPSQVRVTFSFNLKN